jgi:hypothetical protein
VHYCFEKLPKDGAIEQMLGTEHAGAPPEGAGIMPRLQKIMAARSYPGEFSRAVEEMGVVVDNNFLNKRTGV